MQMKHKQKVIAVMISIIIITFIGGCSSVSNTGTTADTTVNTPTPKTVNNTIHDDIIKYVNVELPKIADIENKVFDGYGSVTGANYKDDQTTYNRLKDQVIPDALKLIDGAEAITVNTEELRAVHELYLSGINEENGAFTLMLSAIQTQDSSKVSEANDKLAVGRKDMRDFKAKIKELADKYNVTINGNK